MRTWSQIDSDLDLFLGDAGQVSYSEELRVAAFNRACEYFASTHTAVFKAATATATAYYEGSLVAVPADLVELPEGGIETLPDTYNPAYFMHTLDQINPGDYQQTDGVYVPLDIGYFLPGGELVVKLWYYAKYNLVTGQDTVVNLPAWAEWPVMCLAMAYLMTPMMASQQLLRQFQSKRDAGAPEDNPPRAQARYFMETYQQVVSNVKPQERTAMRTFKA